MGKGEAGRRDEEAGQLQEDDRGEDGQDGDWEGVRAKRYGTGTVGGGRASSAPRYANGTVGAGGGHRAPPPSLRLHPRMPGTRCGGEAHWPTEWRGGRRRAVRHCGTETVCTYAHSAGSAGEERTMRWHRAYGSGERRARRIRRRRRPGDPRVVRARECQGEEGICRQAHGRSRRLGIGCNQIPHIQSAWHGRRTIDPRCGSKMRLRCSEWRDTDEHSRRARIWSGSQDRRGRGRRVLYEYPCAHRTRKVAGREPRCGQRSAGKPATVSDGPPGA
ncbi:hypothetical protein B0H11DRAFT_590177 [Mycena galericulata]|nr:hypothetical protein B0H11DRAFT_590177 [Mycena galericulata]